jgi:ribonuclease J
MNLNLYGHDGAWLMVDLGVTFDSRSALGIEVIMADPTFIVERREQLAGLVLTHAHEDHIGAVPYLWPELRCPIYATPFTASLVRGKLKEAGLGEVAVVTEIPLSGKFSVGPFQLELITLTHSIPEPNAVVLRTPVGTVLHTGDWKFDSNPVIGDNYDVDRLKALADEDVLAMVCDSTNAMVEGATGSEGDVRARLEELVAAKKGRVAVACFASNVARLETVIRVAEACGRNICLVGRSMHRIVEAARETGYLKNLPPFVSDQEIDYLPHDEVLLLCTGSQGEPRAALARIAQNQHPNVFLDKGDTVIFSSRMIPGNEVEIFRLQNDLVRLGVEVIVDNASDIHVSGHPARDELTQMYQWVCPKIAIPVHGEARHLAAHAELAAKCQVPHQLVCANGDLVSLTPNGPQVIERVPTGRLAYDGRRIHPIGASLFKARRKMAHNGSALITVVVDGKGRLDGDPIISLTGLLNPEDDDFFDEIVDSVVASIEGLGRRERKDDDAVAEIARQALRRTTNRLFAKKPVTEVHVVRLEG